MNGHYLSVTYKPNCNYPYYVCFFNKNVSFQSLIAESVDECIEIDGEYYCVADYTNIKCPKCSFTEFVQKVQTMMGNKFKYNHIDLSNTNKTIEIPKFPDYIIKPEIDDSVPIVPNNCDMFGMVTESQRNCFKKGGHYANASIYSDSRCKVYEECFLPVGYTNVSPDTVVAKDSSECIIIYNNNNFFNVAFDENFFNEQKLYCAAEGNIKCLEGVECTFPELVKHTQKVVGRLFLTYYNIDPTKYPKPIVLSKEKITSTSMISPVEVLSTTTIQDDISSTEATPTPMMTTSEFNEVTEVTPTPTISNMDIPESNEVTEAVEIPTSDDYILEPEDLDKSDRVTCPVQAVVTRRQQECWNRGGKYHFISYDRGYNYGCDRYDACFLPERSLLVSSNGVVAKDGSECIIMLDDRYNSEPVLYCAVDITNIPCIDCTFTEYVKRIQKVFGEEFLYYNIDINKYNKPVDLPVIDPFISPMVLINTSAISKERICEKDVNNPSPKEVLCKKRNGYYVEFAYSQPNCNKYDTACFLPSGTDEPLFNAIIATNAKECIEIEGNYYCAADLNTFRCIEGLTCNFTDLVNSIHNTYGDLFKFNFVDPTNITEEIIVPKQSESAILKEFNYIFGPSYISKYCNSRYIDSEQEDQCLKRNGVYFSKSLKEGSDCIYHSACFLPEGSTEVNSDGVIAKDSSECVLFSRKLSEFNNSLYCAVESTNITCPDGMECSFTELLNQIEEDLGNISYINVDVSKISKSIVLPVKNN